jgi:endonuclease G
VSVDDIERLTGQKLPLPDRAKHDKPAHSWALPKGCDKG